MFANVYKFVSSRPQAEIAFAESTCLRSKNFWILPVDVFGMVPNTTAFGVLNPDMWPRQNATISAAEAKARAPLCSDALPLYHHPKTTGIARSLRQGQAFHALQHDRRARLSVV